MSADSSPEIVRDFSLFFVRGIAWDVKAYGVSLLAALAATAAGKVVGRGQQRSIATSIPSGRAPLRNDLRGTTRCAVPAADPEFPGRQFALPSFGELSARKILAIARQVHAQAVEIRAKRPSANDDEIALQLAQSYFPPKRPHWRQRNATAASA